MDSDVGGRSHKFPTQFDYHSYRIASWLRRIVVQTQPTDQRINLPQRRWTVDEYHRMIAAGIITTQDCVELLEGYIIEMVPQEPPHASTTSSVGNDFVLLFSGKAWVRQQLPITIPPNSEPEPDIAVVRLDPNRYRDAHPSPEDVYLLIEVSDSTLKFDREQKSKIYAQANILEYWVIDVKQKKIVVFRQPQNDSYQSQQILNSNDIISPNAFPEIIVNLSTLFIN